VDGEVTDKNRTHTEPGTGLADVLRRLEALKRSSVGTVIYEQIDRLLREFEDTEGRIERAYGLLLHLLLDAYAAEPTADHINDVTQRMIHTHFGNSPPLTMREPKLSPKAMPPEPTEPTPPPRVTPAPPPAAPRATSVPEPSNGDMDWGGPERRVHTAYRLHLDRKRDEIERLQEALSKNVHEVMTQSRELGAMLQIELSALHQAEGENEVENLRKILIGGIEELIQSQRALDQKLLKTRDYLKLMRNDSERLQDELNKVRLLSLTDEFTGLPNRRAFMRRLQDETGRSQRYGSPLALALLDLDEFKNINDVHGHAAGDEILRCYASQILTTLRHHDLVARYGGEEFAVLLPNTTVEGAVSAMRKLQHQAAGHVCHYDGQTLQLPTFSTGVTLYASGDSYSALINRADQALYRAKRMGRNRIELEPTPATSPATTPEFEHPPT